MEPLEETVIKLEDAAQNVTQSAQEFNDSYDRTKQLVKQMLDKLEELEARVGTEGLLNPKRRWWHKGFK